MEEEQDRKSPPLLSKGYYSFDFDALGDGTVVQNKGQLASSPPCVRKEVSNNSDAGQENPPANTQDDCNLYKSLKEPKGTCKRKKPKSSSPKLAPSIKKNDSSLAPDGDIGTMALSQSAEGLHKEDTVVAADKLRKPRTVKKHKTKPVVSNCEEQGEQDKPPVLSQAVSITNITSAPLPDCERVHASKAEQTAADATGFTAPSEENNSEKESSQSEKLVPLPEKPVAQASLIPPCEEKISRQSEPIKTPSKDQQEVEEPEKSSSLPEKILQHEGAHPPSEKRRSRSRSASVASEDAREMVMKKERSGGKVRKSKSKGKKTSSSPKHATVEAGLEGVDGPIRKNGRTSSSLDKERRRRSLSRVNSNGDFADIGEATADCDGTVFRFPTPVVEQKIFEAHSQSLSKGDSDMTSSHSQDSVIKLVQVLKYSQTDWNKLRQELDLNFQAQLMTKEREWGTKLAERDARLAAVEDANKKLRQTNEGMRIVVGEFEKTIGQLQSEKEKSNNASLQSLKDVLKEKDQAVEDLRSVETAFSDLHRRYEKTKAVLEGFKQNEDMLKKCVQDQQNKLKKSEQKLTILKEQAEEKLEKATEDADKVRKSSAAEIAKLEAALRKAHVQVESLEMSLEQKTKENKELTAICDELIAKVQ